MNAYMKTSLSNIPTWDDAYMWANFRFGRGPMTAEEYKSFSELISAKDADDQLVLRARTTLGWYLERWGFYFYRNIRNIWNYAFNREKFKLTEREYLAQRDMEWDHITERYNDGYDDILDYYHDHQHEIEKDA